MHFKYNKMKYLKKYDFYYPIELEIIAEKKLEKLYLHFKNTTESVEEFTEATNEKNLFGFIISQVPSEVEGYYYNGNKKINIKGVSKVESHRLLKVSGHNLLKFNLELSPNNLGIFSSFDSHYFGKKIDVNMRFFPRPDLKIRFNRINISKLK